MLWDGEKEIEIILGGGKLENHILRRSSVGRKGKRWNVDGMTVCGNIVGWDED